LANTNHYFQTYILDLTIYRNIALHLYRVLPVRRISVRIDILIQSYLSHDIHRWSCLLLITRYLRVTSSSTYHMIFRGGLTLLSRYAWVISSSTYHVISADDLVFDLSCDIHRWSRAHTGPNFCVATCMGAGIYYIRDSHYFCIMYCRLNEST
jgi:hypothetical protein